MHLRFVWALPAILALFACKPKPPETPEPTPGPGEVSSYDETAYATGVAPIAVCEHLARMAAEEAGALDPQLDPQMMADCERELSLEAAARGTSNWNDIASCVLAARTGPDIDACDRTYPIPGEAAPSPGDDSRERAVCQHMLEIIMIEATAELGGPPQITEAEARELTEECVAALWTEERPNLSPSEYEELLRCIGSAQNGAQMQQC